MMGGSADVHARVTERLSAYLDGELGPEEKASIDAHLALCIQCRTNLQRFRRTIGNLSQLKQKAPASFLPDIQTQIHARSRGRFFARRWRLFGRIPFEWVSLAMIVAMLVYYIVALRSAPTTVSPGP
jgi:anti-sigma factor RsiW